jgi:3-oxoacyl-[acyl-carrier-protein] synthase III
MSTALRARITGTGMSVPEPVVTNELLSRCMSTNDEWITQRTGIRERRMSPDTYRMLLRLAEAPDKPAFMREVRDRGLDGQIDSSLTVTDLALEASRMALKHAGIGAEDLDCIRRPAASCRAASASPAPRSSTWRRAALASSTGWPWPTS